MKLYKFNFHANYATHSGEMWALSSYDIEKFIVEKHPKATGIHIWVV